MSNKIIIFFFAIVTAVYSSNVWSGNPQQTNKNKGKEKTVKAKEDKDKTKAMSVAKTDSVKSKPIAQIDEVVDTAKVVKPLKFKYYKKDAHASYYSNKFHGRRTANGSRFDNSKYTAAHKKLPFGTKVRVTNEANGKSVIVEITDRGPYSKVREIDLTRKAFMELVDNKNSGSVIVKLEVEEK